MKEKERLDKILETVHEKIQEEVGGLIGAELTLTLSENKLISKEDYFSEPIGKQIFAKMDIVGDVEGKGGLLISVKDAIRLGGTLIMLPIAELDEVASNEDYDGETEDSYGEIANIIAGSYTKTFEEMFPKACRFIRKEQEVLIPIKVEADSDEPLPDGVYYQVSTSMQLDDRQMNDLTMLIPAEPFGLIEENGGQKEEQVSGKTIEGNDPESADGQQGEETTEGGDVENAGNITGTETPDVDVNVSSSNSQQPDNGKQKKEDAEKHKKLVDSLLETSRGKLEEEVGAMLGVEVTCSDLENKIISKEDFFLDEVSGKQVAANLDVVGDQEGKSYLYVSLKDAIRIGCTLIMLPPNEMETAVTEEDFGDDSQDAYGEIANIIAGVYTAVFEEQYSKTIRFIKKDIEQIAPMKVDIGSDEPMADQPHYISSMKFAIEDKEYGKIQILFPASLLDLEALAVPLEVEKDVSFDATTETQKQEQGGRPGHGDNVTSVGTISPGQGRQADILIVSDLDSDTEIISSVLNSQEYTYTVVSYRDNVNNYLPGTFKAVFLVTSTLDEQAFGMAIKISTACSLPLIATGASWTKTRVIKAVKYGVTDILLTPAEEGDIEEKINNNIVKMAA